MNQEKNPFQIDIQINQDLLDTLLGLDIKISYMIRTGQLTKRDIDDMYLM